MKKTILIFGASSFLGSNLVEYLRKDFRVVGTYFKNPITYPNVLMLPCDVLKKDFVTSLVSLIKPDFTIYALGSHSLKNAEKNSNTADALNMAGVVNTCTVSERYGAKFVLLSSEYVFAGENVLYKESDTPLPTTILGNTFASSEFFVQKSCLNYLIFRCCHIYGRSYSSVRKNIFEEIEYAQFKNQSLTMDDNIKFGFLDVQILGKLLKMAFEQRISNKLIQVTSRDHLTHFEFSKLYCDIFEANPDLLLRGKWNFYHNEGLLRGNRPSDDISFRMDCSNIEDTFYIEMPKIDESLKLTKKKLELA